MAVSEVQGVDMGEGRRRRNGGHNVIIHPLLGEGDWKSVQKGIHCRIPVLEALPARQHAANEQ